MIAPLLLASIALPFAVALALAVWPIRRELTVARIALAATILSALASLGAIALWLIDGARFEPTAHTLFAHGSYRLAFSLALDPAAVVFLSLVQFITAIVIRFSRFYLHREPGFQRFFATVLMFEGAMCMLALAGNLQVAFAAWEILGLASFLLIAFYRERQSAVRNALKAYSVYRVADVGMLLAACLETHAGHHVLGLLLLLAAVGKSAQFPFSFWIPRAMEGPTPSSALFYGGLSVHAGAYLLLRTLPLWGDVPFVRIAVGLTGLVTALLCSTFSRVQPTIKAQIAYASITQVGIIFVELALGLTTLALLHLVTNALLRSYQLLVSPSAVAYLLRRHASAGAPAPSEAHLRYRLLSPPVRSTLYAFAINEGYLKELVKGALWSPLRRLGSAALAHPIAVACAGVCVGLSAALWAPQASQQARLALCSATLLVALTFSSCALRAWQRPMHAIAWLGGSSLAIPAAVLAVAPQAAFASMWAASAAGASCVLGLVAFAIVVAHDARITRFAGLSDGHRLATACALVGALGIAGFPILPMFVGADLLLHATLEASLALSAGVAVMLALNGYLAMRTFALSFLGRPTSTEARAAAVDRATYRPPGSRLVDAPHR